MGANTNILTSMVNARQLKDLISYIALPRKQNFDSDTSSWFYMQAWGWGTMWFTVFAFLTIFPIKIFLKVFPVKPLPRDVTRRNNKMSTFFGFLRKKTTHFKKQKTKILVFCVSHSIFTSTRCSWNQST